MLSNNIWPVLTDFREKKQLFIDSPFTLLTVSFLTSWDVKVVIYDLLLPDPVRKATSSRSSLRYIASPPFISFIEQPLCLERTLSHHRHLEPQLLFSVQILCSLERNWVACFISFPRTFVPTISSPQENDTSPKVKYFTKLKITCQHRIFHQQLSDPPKLWQSPPSISIIPIIFDNATAKDQLGPGGVFWCWYRLAVAAIDF